mmetsp:Transcript_6409/g.15979  ORF Transcript_6409/g.15979 Transcript_6409/m.15979 type:complete len:221 (+) Transcript_6409:2292-2954(+)
MNATKPLSADRRRFSSPSRGHMILTLATGPNLANSPRSMSSSISRGKLPRYRLVEYGSRSSLVGPFLVSPSTSSSRPSRFALSRSSCLAIISSITMSIALGFPPARPVEVGGGALLKPVGGLDDDLSCDSSSNADSSPSGLSSSAADPGSENEGMYLVPARLSSNSAPARDPAPCTPACTKFIETPFLGFFPPASNDSANSSNSRAASSASRLRFKSSSA